GDELGDREPAKAALARAHAAAEEGLHLVRPRATELDALPHLARRHLLAAADDHVVVRDAERLGRPIERIEEGAATLGTPEGGAMRCRVAVAADPVDPAEPLRRIEGREPPAMLGGFGTRDAGAVAR